MKCRVYKKIGRLWFEAGWFSGQPFAIFEAQIMKNSDYGDGCGDLIILSVQVLKACITIAWEW